MHHRRRLPPVCIRKAHGASRCWGLIAKPASQTHGRADPWHGRELRPVSGLKAEDVSSPRPGRGQRCPRCFLPAAEAHSGVESLAQKILPFAGDAAFLLQELDLNPLFPCVFPFLLFVHVCESVVRLCNYGAAQAVAQRLTSLTSQPLGLELQCSLRELPHYSPL